MSCKRGAGGALCWAGVSRSPSHPVLLSAGQGRRTICIFILFRKKAQVDHACRVPQAGRHTQGPPEAPTARPGLSLRPHDAPDSVCSSAFRAPVHGHLLTPWRNAGTREGRGLCSWAGPGWRCREGRALSANLNMSGRVDWNVGANHKMNKAPSEKNTHPVRLRVFPCKIPHFTGKL